MQSSELQAAFKAAEKIRSSISETLSPPSETEAPPTQPVLPHSLFADTRGYVEKVVFQINASYSATCYDACAVMIRRLMEVLIIEVYEHHNQGNAIKGPNGEYYHLGELVKRILAQNNWQLGRTTKKSLNRLKTIGDLSAHSRKYNAKRQYIDDEVQGLRVTCEELLYLSGLKA